MASNIISAARPKIVAAYQSAGNTLLANNTPTVFPWEVVVKDDQSAMNTSTGEYTAPETGYYMVSMIVLGQATTNISYYTDIRVNGSSYQANIEAGNAGSNAGFFITALVPLSKDDVMDFQLTQSGAGYTPNAGAMFNFLSIVQVA
jgi:hypothetical protein